MLADRFGFPVATHSRAAIDAIDGFATEVLSHGKGAAVILDAAQHDPHSTLANACSAALYLFLQTAEGVERAAPWLARARQCAMRGGTERERLLVTALGAWARGETEAALAVHLAMARRWPRDLLNFKLAQIHQLNLGDRAGMVALSGFALAANTDVSYAWGLHAFALEQAGELGAARDAGEHAVAMNPDDPWAQHAVAHVFEALGAWQHGIRWLESLSHRWERCSSFMYTHNWWHLALFHLAGGAPQRALALFDTRVWGVRKTYVQDQVNAVSLLARLERCGADVGDRWLDVAAHVRPRIFDRQNAFLDLHFAYALGRAGDDAAVTQLLGSLAEHARRSTSAVWRDLALPAARGVIAYARGQWSEAAAWLGPLLGRLHRLGGSTAQQRWFEAMCHDALSGSQPGAVPSPQRGARAAGMSRRARWDALNVVLSTLGLAPARPRRSARDTAGLRRSVWVGAPLNSEVSYLVAGDPAGPRVVLVHGSPGGAEGWADYLLDPPAGLELVALDRPGNGLSGPAGAVTDLATQAAAVAALLPIDGRPAVLLGHSLGGAVAARVAAQHRVAALVLLAAALDPALENIHPLQRIADWAPLRRRLPRSLRNANDELMALQPELVALAEWLPCISAAVIIVHGTADPLVPVANEAFARTRLCAARRRESVLLAGADHFLPWHAEASVRAAIGRAVAGLPC